MCAFLAIDIRVIAWEYVLATVEWLIVQLQQLK
jgi:hypothetical protein